MSHINDYDYENESSIDSALICGICLQPFIKPKITSCKHIFCRDCINLWFKKSPVCPICRHFSKKTKQLKTLSNRQILQQLEQLTVKCLLCQQMGIKRDDFDNHIDKICPKVIVSCSTNEMKCSWKGNREDLQSHRFFCSSKSKFIRRIKPNPIQLSVFKLYQKSINDFFLHLESIDTHELKLENLIQQSSVNSKITLRNQQLTDADISIIIKSAIINKRCKILDLGNNQIISYGLEKLAESLQNNSTLKMLSLHQNSVSEMSIQCLARSLALNNSALKWLDLEETELNDRSAQYLAVMLTTNTSITGLWLSNNKIGYSGVKMLTSALSYSNKNLKYLDLENNPSIDDSCLDCLMEMIKRNQSLKMVYLNNCQLSTESKAKLQNLANMKKNFRLIL